jgi:hypothetical protein
MPKGMKLLLGGVLGVVFAFVFQASAVSAAPNIANYYLGPLPTDSDSLRKLEKTDLLIVSADQFITRREIISNLKKANPNLVVLAYVPTQSYNFRYWPDDLVFKNMTGISENWWLRDKAGNVISSWPGTKDLNMDHGWSEYLVKFINTSIVPLQNVDGIFFDVVNEGVSWVNHGDVVLGNATTASEIDAEYVARMQYLLQYARDNIKVKFIVINGSSKDSYQPFVNGRMYETFPTPWELGGSWSALMTRLQKNRAMNAEPQLYIFNANSNNSGKQDDYKKVRFGLASSLLVDNVFFSYDHGDQNHGQVWWYDEYDAQLGTPSGNAVSAKGAQAFASDVWRRDFTNGLALVNPTSQTQSVDLGGEYEKLIGTQDVAVNDGQIVDSVNLSPKDGILLYKTFQTISDVVYPNGTFLRFYTNSGKRARNGFFAYEKGLSGGAKNFSGDIDGDGEEEKILVTGTKIKIADSNGEEWYNDYPFGPKYKGELNVAVGKLSGSEQKQIVVAGSTGGYIVVYSNRGTIVKDKLYPLGKTYKEGFTVAVVKIGASPVVMLGTVGRGAAQVLWYDSKFSKIAGKFFPWGKTYKGSVSVAAGDFNGDAKDEIAVTGFKKKPVIGVFTTTGKKTNEFTISGIFGNKKIVIGAVRFNGELRQQLVVMSEN